MEELAQLIQAQTTTYQKLLAKVIHVRSVKGQPDLAAPFGRGPKEALTTTLAIARELGLQTGMTANKVGWAQIGTTPDYIGVLGHLDVVDVGADWDTPPFDLTVKADYMYGRGVLDNKGPILGALFALALIKQQQVPLKRSIRVLFGTDEESGSADIPAYLAENQPPIAGFTPDGKYPAVYAERGLLGGTLTTTFTDNSLAQLTALSGDFDRSYIPDQAQVTFTQLGQRTYHGRKSPSNAPELGDNVIQQIAQDGARLTGQVGQYFQWLVQVVADTTGEKMGIGFQDAASGKLQLSIYALELTTNTLKLKFSTRYPVTLQKATLVRHLTASLPAATQLTIERDVPSLFVDPQQPMIKIMQQVYEQVTGTDGTPVTTTGITYARSLPNIVAFGPSFPGQRGIAHKGNEWLKVSDWQKMIAIDYLTMVALANKL